MPKRTTVTEAKRKTRPETNLVSLVFSALALLVSISSLGISWFQYRDTQQNIQIIHGNKVSEASVKIVNKELIMEVVHYFNVANLSKSPTSVFNVRCESGWRQNPDDDELRIVTPDRCKVFTLESQKEIPVTGSIALAAREIRELKMVSEHPAHESVADLLELYLRDKKIFDDEQFLLFLADRKMDFFGNSFPLQYHYLQKTSGEHLCLGVTTWFKADAVEQPNLESLIDLYVGPMSPVIQCENSKKDKTILNSVPYKHDFYNFNEPLWV